MPRIVNYRCITSQPDGNEHVDLYQTRDLAESYAADLVGWPTRIVEQVMDVEIGTVVTILNGSRGRTYTGPIEEFGADVMGAGPRIKVQAHRDRSWWGPWELLSIGNEEL